MLRGLAAAAVLLAAVAVVPTAAAAPPRPNIVLVLTDDQRADTLWAMPNVQRHLVRKGVTFANAFASNSICCPSRSSILTGNYSHTTGVYTNQSPYGAIGAFRFGKGAERQTVATWLDAAGYRTGLFGKYINLQKDAYFEDAYIPPGWDEFWVGAGPTFSPTLMVNGVRRWFAGDYLTTVIGEAAREFVRTTPAETPFFVYLAPYAPHTPARAEPRYQNMQFPALKYAPAAFNEADVSDKPSFIRTLDRLSPREARNAHAFRTDQLQALVSVDNQVDALVRELEATGRMRDTIFIYMSDNGVNWGEHRLPVRDKANQYDGSSRIPLVIRYDALHLTPRVESRLAANLDVAPTIAALTGVRAPAMEGRDLSRLLPGTPTDWGRYLLLEHVPIPGAPEPAYCGIRTPRYLYVRHGNGEGELYDGRYDPYERRNVYRSRAYADVRSRLLAKLRRQCDPAPPGYVVP